ncbi:hypothetical protein BD289DRAFT_296744 [Coniella lustricola]|uniref:Uncharacterized protein n=1 Tax=Coniella lustricola TaxID=2025994 RepID=A0A2T3A4N1_9PEZI|nr:hypothetical protein BD289DRAFT_296744 [Coniella lustricola]
MKRTMSSIHKRINNDSDSPGVRQRSKRPRQEIFEQPSIHVGHAEAYGDARMMTTGPVRENHTIYENYNIKGDYHAGPSPSFVGERPALSAGQQQTRQGALDILSADEKKKLIELLYFDRVDERLTTIKKRQRDTCKWLLKNKDYCRWQNLEKLGGADGFFWLRGNPGTGKSIAMKFLFQTLECKFRKQENKVLVSFFFYARGASMERSTFGLYRSLLYALFSGDTSLDIAFDKCYKRPTWLRILTKGKWEKSDEQLLKELLGKVVASIVKKKKQLYCFVDALDECPQLEVNSMIKYFENLASRVDDGNFRICFSSRHYPAISIRTELKLTLEKEASHRKDIATYIQSQLYLGEDISEGTLTEIKAEILEKSAGIFLWVNLVVCRLNQVAQEDGRVEAIRGALRNIPTVDKETPIDHGERALYGFFRDIIQKDNKNLDKLVRICHLIYCARRPLTPQELHVALQEEYDEPFDHDQDNPTILAKEILRYSKGFAETTVGAKPTVQFIHETVREFLGDGGLKALDHVTVGPSIDSAGHELFKEICLRQIKAPVEKRLDFITRYLEKGRDPKTGLINFRSRIVKLSANEKESFLIQASKHFPLLRYAVENILSHANESKYLDNAQGPFLQHFPLESWVPLYNLFSTDLRPQFSGSKTPLLHILAYLNCTQLVREPSVAREEYSKISTGEMISTPLACAIYKGYLDTARVLVGVEPLSTDAESRQPSRVFHSLKETLLIWLVRLGDQSLAAHVLQDSNCDPVQLKPFQWPIRSVFGPVEISERMLELLIMHRKLEGFPLPESGFEFIKDHATIAERTLPCIDNILSIDPTLLTRRCWGRATMWEYTKGHNCKLLQELFWKHSGADKDALNRCLHAAAHKGQLDLVKIALDRGADISHRDEQGRSVLHCAANDSGGGFNETIQYLLDTNPNLVDVTDAEGLTPLQSSGFTLSDNATMKFLSKGADPNTEIWCQHCACNEKHQLPLVTICALRGLVWTLEALLCDKRCDPNAPDVFGRAPLTYCFAFHPEVGSPFSSIS